MLVICPLKTRFIFQVDKVAYDSIGENAEAYLQNLEPWVMVCVSDHTFKVL